MEEANCSWAHVFQKGMGPPKVHGSWSNHRTVWRQDGTRIVIQLGKLQKKTRWVWAKDSYQTKPISQWIPGSKKGTLLEKCLLQPNFLSPALIKKTPRHTSHALRHEICSVGWQHLSCRRPENSREDSQGPGVESSTELIHQLYWMDQVIQHEVTGHLMMYLVVCIVIKLVW